MKQHSWFTKSFYTLLGDHPVSTRELLIAIFTCFFQILALEIILVLIIDKYLESYNLALFLTLSLQMLALSISDFWSFVKKNGSPNQIVLCVKIVLYLCYLVFSFIKELDPDFLEFINFTPSLAALAILVSCDRIGSVCKDLYKTMLKSNVQDKLPSPIK